MRSAADRARTPVADQNSDLAWSVAVLGEHEGTELRTFCLDVIDEAFGHGYRPDWHADLDELPRAGSDYRPGQGGCFLVARHGIDVIGCGGLRALSTRPDLASRFSARFPDPNAAGAVWRVYVDRQRRSQGLGRRLVAELERVAAVFGYRRLYLHTSGDSPRSVSFWLSCGYEAFADERVDGERVVHMDKTLPDLEPPIRIANGR